MERSTRLTDQSRSLEAAHPEQDIDNNTLNMLADDQPENTFSMVDTGDSNEAPVSTTPSELAAALQELSEIDAGEVFADGMESSFSRKLILAVEIHGDIAVCAIERLMTCDSVNVEVAGEILRQIGSMQDHRTHRSRLKVLTSSLKSADPRLRDAASIGLAALDDPAAIKELREAIDCEVFPRLKQNLTLALNQLQETQWPTS